LSAAIHRSPESGIFGSSAERRRSSKRALEGESKVTLLEIAAMPTCVKEVPRDCRAVHESVLRGYQILQLVKRWLRAGVPMEIVLEVCGELEQGIPRGEVVDAQ
jgi:hypothetical protein